MQHCIRSHFHRCIWLCKVICFKCYPY